VLDLRISSCQCLEGLREGWRGAGTRAGSDRSRGDGFGLKEGKFRSDLRKKFFPVRVVRTWLQLPREAVAAPSLAGLKSRLDGALSALGWWKGSLPMVWNQMIFKVPSNPNHSLIL